MKELKDIILKKGDIIYFDDGDRHIISFGLDNHTVDDLDRIIKIERPVKYETIYEAPKQILEKEEKEYLENVIRPFRYKVFYISKFECYNNVEFIMISIKNGSDIYFPHFKKGTMYKGMEADKAYTLKKLGLFE